MKVGWLSTVALAAVLGVAAGAAQAVAGEANGDVGKLASASTAIAEPVPAAAVAEPEAPPKKTVVARVDLSDQTMTVYVDERLAYTFKVSTGRRGYGTPTGRWNAAWLSPRHRSRKYNNAPMPWSVFFHDGYAVHGTTDLRRLGRPASHGCVRLHPDNAKIFYSLVKENGKQNTLVSIVR
jgi:hypothetical protein